MLLWKLIKLGIRVQLVMLGLPIVMLVVLLLQLFIEII
jgi:hypothetical protein